MKNQISFIQKEQKRIAAAVTKEFPRYYLTGGTALAFYFNHRFSEDLDFFSQRYDPQTPNQIMDYVSQLTGFTHELKAESKKKGLVRMKVFMVDLSNKYPLKIDFVQDYHPNIKKTEKGLHSIEDIYFRKCSIGMKVSQDKDVLGRELPTGRQAAKDIFDLFLFVEASRKTQRFLP